MLDEKGNPEARSLRGVQADHDRRSSSGGFAKSGECVAVSEVAETSSAARARGMDHEREEGVQPPNLQARNMRAGGNAAVSFSRPVA